MEKNNVYLLMCNWRANGEDGTDVVNAYTTNELAEQALKNFVSEEKKNTWLSDYFENCSQEPTDDDYDAFECDNKYFMFATNGYTLLTEAYIQELPLINQ